MTAEAISNPRDPAPRTVPGRGNWWVQPAAVSIGFTAFIIYSVWSTIFASGPPRSWEIGPYLSPFYSPLFNAGWWPLSPAILIVWAPLGFRATCYYYRKAYYRAFFWDPPACAIREPSMRKHYTGERKFPFILNNFHRFFLYLALVVLAILWIDTIRAFDFHGGLYVGLGTIIMLVNVVLLTGYTFSCHALRHLVGGNVNCYSCVRAGNVRHGLWGAVTKINPYHPWFAWASLISVVVVDIYIRLLSAGVFGAGLSCFHAHTGC